MHTAERSSEYGVQGMMEAMEKTYNESQIDAVTAGLSGSPVVLIQASPPSCRCIELNGLGPLTSQEMAFCRPSCNLMVPQTCLTIVLW